MKQTINQLLDVYHQQNKPKNPQKLSFKGVDGYDVYNPSQPFDYCGKSLIIARVEKRDSEVSQAVFFEDNQGFYVRREDLSPLPLQDPCITIIDGEYVVGGTYVTHQNDNLVWYTKFYKGAQLNDLKPSLDAPLGMKDVRLLQLKDHRIAVFTRPQGEKGKRGKIGFFIADTYASITTEAIDNAPLFDQFIDQEWGGANQIIQLDDQTLGVLGHIACFTEGYTRHYYAMTFKVNLLTKKASPMKMIAKREDFLEGPAKREDLYDVLFSAALSHIQGDLYKLYCGVSDVEIQTIEVVSPF
jgi:hypothetical protein